MLVSFGGQTITYDEIGNPISYLGNTMSWTGRTLDSIVKADGTQISYTYDLDGIRTKKVVNGVTTEYFVNGTTILAQKTGDNVIWYIYDSDGQILGFTYNDTPYYYVKNLQGDVLKVIDTNGTVVASYTYDPWGKLLSATGTMADINPIRYRGYYYDSETGLYYLNSRYYDPDTCRFVNADDISALGVNGDFASYNLFAYCGNNPIARADDGGYFWNTIIGAVVGGIVGGIKAAVNGDNILAGVAVGAGTGALAGLAVDVAIATGGVGAIAIAAVGGAISSGVNYAATEVINDRKVDIGTLAIECSVGAVFNVLSFGVGGGTTKNVVGTVVDNMKQNFTKTVLSNTVRNVAGNVVSKSVKGVVKNVVQNCISELFMGTTIVGGSMVLSEIIKNMK